MTPDDQRPFATESTATAQDELRQRVSTVLRRRAAAIAAETAATFPLGGADTLDSGDSARISDVMVQLLAAAVRDGRLEAVSGLVANLRAITLERTPSTRQLFGFAYLTERTALAELAAADEISAIGDHWNLVAQLVRRASFDVLAAFVERTQHDIGEAPFVDGLTTLHTWSIFEAVLIKECERAGRVGLPVALILFDVDRLSAINEAHGYGVGDRILERLGILIRKYFRQHDWVARHSDDSIAVLLMGADAQHADALAERVRATVENRLGFTDHRNDIPVPVTVTASVTHVEGASGSVIDPERLLSEAIAALQQAKEAGRNRVESASGSSAIRTPPRNSPSA